MINNNEFYVLRDSSDISVYKSYPKKVWFGVSLAMTTSIICSILAIQFLLFVVPLVILIGAMIYTSTRDSASERGGNGAAYNTYSILWNLRNSSYGNMAQEVLSSFFFSRQGLKNEGLYETSIWESNNNNYEKVAIQMQTQLQQMIAARETENAAILFMNKLEAMQTVGQLTTGGKS